MITRVDIDAFLKTYREENRYTKDETIKKHQREALEEYLREHLDSPPPVANMSKEELIQFTLDDLESYGEYGVGPTV